MADEPEQLVYGFKPEDWEALPEWLQTFVMESNERNAHAVHAAHRQSSQTLQEQAWKTADFVLKTLITVEGGSLVAILAFLGSLTQRRSQLDVDPLLAALGGIGVALFFAIGAALCAYLVAAHYAAGHDYRLLSFQHPFIQGTPKGSWHDRRGERIRLVGIGLVIASIVSAAVGISAFGLFTAKALNSPELPPPMTALDAARALQVVSELPPKRAPSNP